MHQKEKRSQRIQKVIDLTTENYVVPEGEELLFHCRIEVKKFNSETGERQSSPRVQKFGKKVFESGVYHNLKKQGYTVDVLHNPKEWEMLNAAKIASNKAAAAAAAAEASEEKEDERRKELEYYKNSIRNEVVYELKGEFMKEQRAIWAAEAKELKEKEDAEAAKETAATKKK